MESYSGQDQEGPCHRAKWLEVYSVIDGDIRRVLKISFEVKKLETTWRVNWEGVKFAALS